MSQVVALPPHGDHVHVSNRFRNPNEPAFQFRVPSMSLGMSGVGSYLMQIKSVVMDHMMPNIQTGKNDVLSVTVNGVTTLIVLPSYEYNIDSLVTALNTALGGLAAGLLLTYDYDFKFLTLTVPAATTFRFNSPMVQGVDNERATLDSKYDRLLNMMGFYQKRNINYTGIVDVIGELVSLKGTTCYKICVNQSMGVVTGDPFNPQILCDVPVTVPYGETIGYEPIQPRTFTLNPNVMEYLAIDVRDDYGDRVKVPDKAFMELSFSMIPTAKTNN